MKLYVYYATPADKMAFDAIKGMVLVHALKQVEFCAKPEECDIALFFISGKSDIDIVIKQQNILYSLEKPYRSFYIHGNNAVLPNIEKLVIEDWSESEIINILKVS